MSEKNTGGPAFPRSDERGLMGEGLREGSDGMSLRDYFAAQALIGLLAHASGEAPQKAPSMAFKLADAMLEEREAGHE